MKTFMVTVPNGASVNVECDGRVFVHETGAIIFCNGDVVVAAIAHGSWISVSDKEHVEAKLA